MRADLETPMISSESLTDDGESDPRLQSTSMRDSRSRAWPSAQAWGSAEYGFASDRGQVRKNNEDHHLASSLADLTGNVDSELGYVFAVADGMGGAAAGEEASAAAIEGLEGMIRSRFPLTPPWNRDTRWVRRQLRRCFEQVDRGLVAVGLDDAARAGSGSTLTVALSLGSTLHIAHAGDSRAYLYREGRLLRLTRDHTVAQALVDNGIMSSDEAMQHRSRHVLTNVLGSAIEGVDVDFLELEMRDRDRILVCTDGLIETATDQAIAAILGDNPDCRQAASALIAEALMQGGPDNVTAVVACVRLEMRI